ncbi:MAG: MoaD/ThiS family protein [Chloroflexi bacterium]|nr:MoaD/ThiS family protein [Chloroflexota bacterium]
MRTIKLLATLRDVAGTSRLDVPFDTGTVHDLTAAISRVSPALAGEMLDDHGNLSGLVHIFVNGRNIEWLNGMDTVIEEGDSLTLIPPTAGG